LEKKLEITANQIGKFAKWVCFLSVISHLLFLGILILSDDDIALFSNDTLLKVGKIAIIAVVILIVAIPEGLPLAVSIAMALSINSLKMDEILIKNIESVQNCAMLHDLCVGKTGTLTKGRMTVAKYHVCNQQMATDNDRDNYPDTFNMRLEIPQELKEIIKESVISNTDVRIECNDVECKYEPMGQPLEVGLIQFLIDNGEDIQNVFIERNKYAEKLVQLPFDQELKRKVVVRRIKANPERVRVYVKGAPEYVLPLCNSTLSMSLQMDAFSQDDQYRILEDIIARQMAGNGHKPISFAFKEMSMQDLNRIMQQMSQESQEFRIELECNLTYLSTFALDDPIVDDIQETVQLIRYGHAKTLADSSDSNQVNIRMVTGDHIDTAKWVGVKTGIVKEEELDVENCVMTGVQFREHIGPHTKIWDPVNNEYKFEFQDQRRFDDIKRRLKILARASSEDKFILVSGIKQKGGLVGMTGDSIADAEALKRADVGLAMGTGCDVAKDNADLVILDNRFMSIYRAVKWGRAIFDNVRKFLQFQLTINIVICFVTIMGGLTLGRTPLNVIQMLWTNLIMDILGAIAIGTEPYMKEDKELNRISRKEKMMTATMWR